MLKLDEQRQANLIICEVQQPGHAGWMNWHPKKREKKLSLRAMVLVFQSRSELMFGKLILCGINHFPTIQTQASGTFQLRTLQGQYVLKLENSFKLCRYHGELPINPFQAVIKHNQVFAAITKCWSEDEAIENLF